MSTKVTVLSKPACGACVATTSTLDRLGVEYEKIDITVDEAAFQRAIDLGHQAAPVVINEETGESWAGFKPDRLASLVA